MELIIQKFLSAAEVERYLPVIDARITIMKKPWQAATGAERKMWQSMIDGELDQRSQLSKAIKALKTNRVQPAAK